MAAAVLACALPVTQSALAVAKSGAYKLLSSDLPSGLTLRSASIDQVGDALYTATSQHPDMAMSFLEVAILAKRPPPHHGNMPCPDLIKLLKKTIGAAPNEARQLLELAISLDPECTDTLNDLLADPTLLGIPGVGNGEGSAAYGFGAGLGADFPGSPGFTGSPPGGTTALPPTVTTPVTTVT
jgi:hypothetical protein